MWETRQRGYRATGCRVEVEAVPCGSLLSLPRTIGTCATMTTLGVAVRAFLPRPLPPAEPPPPPLARLGERTGQKKNRVYCCQAYVKLLSR